MTTTSVKRYFICDKCGNPIEQPNDFMLEWKHNIYNSNGTGCHIVHVGCGYNETPDCGIILCERQIHELNTKNKILSFIETLSKLTLLESKTFFSCIKRLLAGGDVKL